MTKTSLTGNLLKEARLLKNLSQAELAKITRVTQSYIAQIENGRHDNLTPDRVKVLAEALDIEYGDLVAIIVIDRYGVDFTENYPNDLRTIILDKKISAIKEGWCK